MSSQRIKGQEVQVILTRAGVLEETFTAIKSFETTDQFEVKSEGYLGEKGDRKDDIWNGVKFSFEMHISKKAWWTFKRAMKDRARRITPDVVFNISGVFTFPGGEVVADTLLDVKWGDCSVSTSSRQDYVSVKLGGECDNSQDQSL